MKHALSKTTFLALTILAFVLGHVSRAAADILVPTNSSWKYLDNGTDQGTAWRASAFNDTAWASGLAPLGYEDAWIVTTNSFGPDANNKYVTTYYRKSFNLDDASAVTNLLLRVQRDDGVVVYLNGTEVLRNNLPSGDVAFGTLALTAIGGVDETTFVNANPSASLLVNGANVLAVEMHQSSANSSDLSFDLELSGNFTPVNPVVEITSPADNSTVLGSAVSLTATAGDVDGAIAKVEFYQASVKVGEALVAPYRFTVTGLTPGSYTFSARAYDTTGLFTDSDAIFVTVAAAPPTFIDLLGATWKYLVTPTAAPADWTQASFDDSSWSSGASELGYGDSDEATVLGFGPDTNNKYPTTYFRKAFTVSNPSAYSSISMTVRYDDGFVVYLNGTEIRRVNMPDGAPAYNTLATQAADYSDDVSTVPTSAFVAGNNVIAVEMHQGSANSSDISFGLQLQGILPPTVAITSPVNGATLNSPVNFNLEATASDADGTVAKVDFFDGATFLGSAAAAPFRVGVSNLVEGLHVLTAVATDNSGSSSTSTAVTINVVDPNPPVLVSASATTNKITVVYSKRVLAPSATAIANYAITPAASIQGVQFGSTENIVVITTSSILSPGVNYSLRVSNVQGSGGTTIAPNSTIGFEVIGFTFADIGGPALPGSSVIVPGGLDVIGSGTDINGTSDQFQFSYEASPRVGDFDVRVRVAALAGTDLWAKAGLMARESLTGGSRYAAAFTTPGMSGSFFQYRYTNNGPTFSLGGAPATYPNTWLRLKRAGDSFTSYTSLDGNTWMLLGGFNFPSNPLPSSVYVGLAVTSRDSSRSATGQFREFGNVVGGTVSGLVYDREPLGPSARRTGLIFSEIMYNPKTTNAHEYIEIYNSNPFFEELTGYRLSGTINYAFPAGTRIEGGAFLVVARDPSALQAQYGLTGVLGPWDGASTNGLPAQGGLIRLRGEGGAILLNVDYGTRAPWPVAADGTGHSLVLARPSYGEADPKAWAASDSIGGSPGRAEPFSADPLRNVVINEFLAHTDFPQEDYLELYNHGNQPVDLSNAYLTDDPTTNKFRIPAGTIIPARGFVSFIQTTQTFALSSTGERVFLINSNATRVIDAVNFGPQENGVSTGRVPDGAPAFYRLATLTPGAANGRIRSEAVVINEIMYAPISGNSDDEYVELYNRTASPVSVGRWRFVNGIDYTLPSDAVIPANGYLVVAKNRTNLFAKYSNLNTNNTVGNFDGTLANGGERLAIAAPDYNVTTNLLTGVVTTNIEHHIVNEVTYADGGKWGWWSDGGGSSLELKDPNSDIRQPANWADSDETSKGIWTTVELSGTLGESLGSPINDNLQIFLLGVGECLIDDVEVRNGGGTGANLLTNPGFETGTAAPITTGVDFGGWIAQGSHDQSSFENTGFSGARSFHLRAGSRGDNGGNRVRSTTIAATSPVLIRARVKWLRGWPEILFRLHGGTFEVGSRMQIQPNLGTPGAANSKRISNAGPAIYDVAHSPILPAEGEAVVVTAKASDPGQTFSLAVKVRQDPATTYTTTTMNDNGTGGDAIAGDGIYSATVTGRPAGTTLAFYIEATDSLGGVNTFPQELFPVAPVARMFPLDAPAREAVIRWGDRMMPGSFGNYRLWLTAANTARWNARRPVLNNCPSDGTFVYNNYRVIYNMHPQFAGSPWHRGSMQTGPDGTLRVDFDIEMPVDDKFLGTTDFVWNNPGNPGGTSTSDTSCQSEQTSYTIFKEIGVHYNYRRYVHVFVNGNQRSTTSDRPGNFIFEDSQQPNGDVIAQWFPDADNGDLYKIEDWFEFPENGDDFGTNNDADLQRRTVQTNGVPTLQTSAYRFMWRLRSRSAGKSANDYSSMHEMINTVSPTDNTSAAINVPAINNVLDYEQWMRIFACQHTCGNWDSYGYNRGKNAYTYKPNGGRFNQWTWDIDFTMGIGGDGAQTGLFGANDPRVVAMFNTPEIKRAAWRAYIDIINGPLQNSFMDPILDAKAAALTANNVNFNPASVTTIKNFIRDRRAYIAGLVAGNLSNAPFALRTPLTFTTNDSLVTVSGIANVRVKDIFINGQAYPVTWTSETNWTARIVLNPGDNTNVFVGGGATQTMNITFTGAGASPVGSLVINEIMYNPANPDATFVEILNRAATPFHIGGWLLNGLDYTFPTGTIILPGQYVIIAKNLGAFAAAYGSSVVPLGVFDGSLDRDGETIALVKPGSNGGEDLFVDRVRYEAQAPWPMDAVINNSALQLIDSSIDNSRSSAWAAGLDWRQAKITGNMGSSTNALRVYLYLDTPGNIYIDDVSLVEGTTAEAGVNLLQNGDFESDLVGPWAVSTNNTGSVIDTSVSHRGNASLKLISLTAGSAAITRALTQPVGTARTNTIYTLSFWYLPTASANNITARTAPGSAIQVAANVRPVPASPGAASTLGGSLPPYDSVWMNEVQPVNVNGPIDNAGDREPWIELFNGGATAIDLSGYYLAKSYTNNLTQWQFPAGTFIGAGEFKVIWADGETAESTPTSLHTSFRVDPGSGTLALVRLVGGKPQITDYLTYTGVPNGASYGDFPDGQPFNRLTMFGATAGTTNIGRSVDVYINEWMASNPSFLADPADQDFDDWFELYNASTNTVDLGGFYLTDDLGNRRKFRIPANGQYTIPPGGFLLVWADDETAQNTALQPDLHAAFQLARGGESLALFAPDGSTVIDSITFGNQTNNVTQGRFPDGTANVAFLTTPTPRAANQLGGAGNTAPTLQPIADRVILFGQTVSFTAQGSDSDVPAQTLTYSLAPGAPSGASIVAGTGVFTWTPTAAQAPGTNEITVRVTDSGVPPITVSRTFTVIVQTPTATFSISGNNLQIAFGSVSGKNYRIEFKNSLGDATWTPLPGSENIVGNGGTISVNTLVTANPQRFFRIVQLN